MNVNCVVLPGQIIGKVLAINLAALFVYMSLFFLVAKWRKRLDTVDIAWGLGFIMVAWIAAYERTEFHSIVIAVLVSLWGLRLAVHILRRAKLKGEDPRYVELTKKWKGNVWLRAYFSIFLLQGLLIAIVSLPIVTATGLALEGWEWLTIAGAIVWLAGFAIESIADMQLASYLRLSKSKRPKVLKTGLWRFSRHPNYFGEIVQWFGIAVIALQASWGWIGLAGPLLLTILILFVSGIPPIEKRRAKDAAYRSYQKHTSKLILLPPKKS